MGISLNDKGSNIVKRGGADGNSDDDDLVLELIARAPGMAPAEYEKLFIALREEYGEDALRAVRSGHVKFELRTPRDGEL